MSPGFNTFVNVVSMSQALIEQLLNCVLHRPLW